MGCLAPYFLALTAATPLWRGYLAETDCRWKVISESVDDRTEEERDPHNSKYVLKSRYDGFSLYLGNYEEQLKEKDSENDVSLSEKEIK